MLTPQQSDTLKQGFENGLAAANEETIVGAIFRGCAGSLRHRFGGTGYEKDEYSIAFRAGYMHYINPLTIWTSKDGVVTKIVD